MHGITNYQDYLNYWENIKDKVPLYISYLEVRCKFCNSNHIIKYGHFKNIQRWWCKDCQRKFADNHALPGMRTPTTQIASVIHMYYEGMPLNTIRRKLEQDFNSCPSDSTIYEWINRFTIMTLSESENLHPEVGDKWLLYESSVKIAGKKYWLIDVFDTGTRFLLATKLTSVCNVDVIQAIISYALEKAGKTPEILLVDRSTGCLNGLDLSYGIGNHIIQKITLNKDSDNNELEHWRVTLKDRNRILRTLKDEHSAATVLGGWLVHYNYFRPNEKLAGRTPAKKSGIKHEIGLARLLPSIHQG